MQLDKPNLTIEDAEKLTIEEIQGLYSKYINPYQTTIFKNFPFGKDIFVRAEGMYMYTSDQKKILDFTGGVGVLNHGHNHKKIIEARKKYLNQNGMEVHKLVFSRYLAALSFNISNILGGKLNKTFICNSGAEAVEGALKIAYRVSNNKKYVLSSNKSYHGKLIGTGTISGSYSKKNNFPKMDGNDFFNFNDPNSLKEKIEECEKKGGVYAVIIEPFSATLLQSCSEEFIQELVSLKKKYDFSIICDEVYCAWYKCGEIFYFKHFKNFEPDIITLSKAMGGGKSSISAYVTNNDYYNKVYGSIDKALLHTTTYNGFAEECITAIEAINILIDERFDLKVKDLERNIQIKLQKLKEKNPSKIKSFTGKGSLFGIEFFSFLDYVNVLIDKIPFKSIQDKKKLVSKLTVATISSELYSKYNILCNVSESDNSDYLYVTPSIIVKNDELEYFFSSLEKVLNSKIDLKILQYIFSSFINLIK
jgi:putrescine aminotransferase